MKEHVGSTIELGEYTSIGDLRLYLEDDRVAVAFTRKVMQQFSRDQQLDIVETLIGCLENFHEELSKSKENIFK